MAWFFADLMSPLLLALIIEARGVRGVCVWAHRHACHMYVRERSELILNSLSFTYSFSKYFGFHERSDLKLVKAEKSK